MKSTLFIVSLIFLSINLNGICFYAGNDFAPDMPEYQVGFTLANNGNSINIQGTAMIGNTFCLWFDTPVDMSALAVSNQATIEFTANSGHSSSSVFSVSLFDSGFTSTYDLSGYSFADSSLVGNGVNNGVDLTDIQGLCVNTSGIGEFVNIDISSFCIIVPSPSSPSVIFVDNDAEEGGDGSSWSSAFKYLQDALDQTVSGRGDEVWIAEGTYYPDQGSSVSLGDPLAEFIIKDGVSLIGGFNGNEDSLDESQVAPINVTLSGEISSTAIWCSKHILNFEDYASGSIRNISITNAIDSAVRGNNYNISAENCHFYNNHSNNIMGAVASNGFWDVTNCNFYDNSNDSGPSVARGGNWNIKDSLFTDNVSSWYCGLFYQSGIEAFFCFFRNNSGEHHSIAQFGYNTYGSEITFDHCIFYQNNSSSGLFGHTSVCLTNATIVESEYNLTSSLGTSYSTSDKFKLLNSIIYRKPANIYQLSNLLKGDIKCVNYNDEILLPSTSYAKNLVYIDYSFYTDVFDNCVFYPESLIEENPLFVDIENPLGDDGILGTIDDGLRLVNNSPAINQGNPAFLQSDLLDLDNDGDMEEPIPFDILMQNRVIGDSLDLGVYEYDPGASFTVSVIATEGGLVDPIFPVAYNVPTVVTINAIPNDGYVFNNWTGNEAINLSTDNPLAFTATGDLTITANFTEDENDSDGDGLTNYQEIIIYQTNPNDSDTSNDGLEDGYIVNYGLNPNTNFTSFFENSTLFVEEKAEGIQEGIAQVLSDPNSYDLHSLNEIRDLRPGSTIIEIHNNEAILTMEVEESDDLGVWTNGSATSIQIPIDAEAGKKFFRFKMAE